MLTVAFTHRFEADADRVFSAEELEDLVFFLADQPEAGDIVTNTGGVRKLRWRAQGRGKRGGARVIYYYMNPDRPLYLLSAYAKNEKADLTPRDKAQLRRVVAEIARSAKLV